MREPPGRPSLLRTRRLLYGAALGVALLVGFVATAWAFKDQLAGSQYLVSLGVLGFVLGLLWLRPRRLPHLAGLLCLTLAGVGLWLGGAASLVEGVTLRYLLGLVGATLLPAAWVLLAAGVSNWRLGVGSYLLAGLAFVLILYCADLVFYPQGVDGWRLPSPRVLATLWLFWPAYVLYALGVTAWVPPGGD